MKPDFDLSLYLVIDRDLISMMTLGQTMEQAIKGGITLIQLHEKDAFSLDFYHTALGVKRMTDAKRVSLITNDRVDIALVVDAMGVHVRQEDLPAKTIRATLREDKPLGVSIPVVEETLRTERDGADYFGVGTMFTIGTKTDAWLVSMEELRKIRSAVSIPIIIVGSINAKTIPLFRGNGTDGVAVVSAIIAAQDTAAAARSLKDLLEQQKPTYRE